MPLITLEEIQDQHPDGANWTSDQNKRAESNLAGVLDWISRNAPCLTADPNPLAPGKQEARMIVAEAILRTIDSTGNIGSEGIGSSQVNYIDRAALPTLTRADKASLKALCPGTKRKKFGTIRTRPGY